VPVRDQLIAIAEDMLSHRMAGTLTRAEEVASLPASTYTDPALFELEKQRIFRSVPLMLAASCELPKPGDFKTIDMGDVPVLVIRGKDGKARAFLNACTHRGAMLASGCGHVARLTCPYHAWSFSCEGRLLSVASREVFGDVEPDAHSLVEFPTAERAGLIWATLDPGAGCDLDAFLHGIVAQLEGFNFANWTHFRTQSMSGANWKLAFDAHLEFYHLPVLHRNTFGPKKSNLAQYYFFGPHQRIGLVSKEGHVLDKDDVAGLADLPQDEWPMETLLFGEWILFPNVSINCFDKGGRIVIIS
jgi:carnitine monooxygenase subunit